MLHHVLRVQGNVAAVLVLLQHVDAAAVGGYPDVAVAVFHHLVGSVVAQRPFVVVVMADVLHVIAAVAVGGNLVEAVVFVAQPVVAFRVAVQAVGTAEGAPVAVVGDGGVVAVPVDDIDDTVLVA